MPIPEIPKGEQYLPPGIHQTLSWSEFYSAFGWNPRRRELLDGLQRASRSLSEAGCSAVYVDGSFVTRKEIPGDFDACWDPRDVDPELLDPAFFSFANKRAEQKAKWGGEFFPSDWDADGDGQPFLEFFQVDRDGVRKGIVLVNPQTIVD